MKPKSSSKGIERSAEHLVCIYIYILIRRPLGTSAVRVDAQPCALVLPVSVYCLKVFPVSVYCPQARHETTCHPYSLSSWASAPSLRFDDSLEDSASEPPESSNWPQTSSKLTPESSKPPQTSSKLTPESSKLPCCNFRPKCNFHSANSPVKKACKPYN